MSPHLLTNFEKQRIMKKDVNLLMFTQGKIYPK